MNKREIEIEINRLEQQLRDYNREYKEYNDALSYASKLKDSIANSQNNINETKENLKKSFMINGQIVSSSSIESTISEINAIKNDVNNTIIPGIQAEKEKTSSKIYNTQEQIKKLERQYATAEE